MQIAFTVDLHRGNSRSSDVTSHCERGFGLLMMVEKAHTDVSNNDAMDDEAMR